MNLNFVHYDLYRGGGGGGLTQILIRIVHFVLKAPKLLYMWVSI